MSSLFSPIVYPALRSLLVNRLQKTADFRENFLQKTEFVDLNSENLARSADFAPDSSSLSLEDIPLSWIKENTQIEYYSAIALKLAQRWQQPATAIAQALVASLTQTIEAAKALPQPQPLDRVWQHFEIHSASSGWIQFCLTQRGLAEWLQILTDPSIDRKRLSNLDSTEKHRPDHWSDRDSTSIFEIMYTHARCCSLLRLAERAELIELQGIEPGSEQTVWSIVVPKPIPWLSPNQALRCQHPCDRRLIVRLAITLDRMASSIEPLSVAQSLKLAQSLSQEFQVFYAACRIFGEVSASDPALAQTRLGLTLATQRVMQSLLQDYLGVPAPEEL